MKYKKEKKQSEARCSMPNKWVDIGELRVFEIPKLGKVRFAIVDGQPWFIAKDLCEVLGHKKARTVVSELDGDIVRVIGVRTRGGDLDATVVSEPGLYSLMLDSPKAEADEFREWSWDRVALGVIKNGFYALDPFAAEDDYARKFFGALREQVSKYAVQRGGETQNPSGL